MRKTLIAATLAAVASTSAHAVSPIAGWSKLWTFTHGSGTSVAGQTSEIVAFDATTNQLWVAGLKGVDILDASNGSFLQHIDTTGFGEANSVAIRNGVAAIAIASPAKTAPGLVLTYQTATRSLLQSYDVGALPDMVTFTPDGRILTANEGEPLPRSGLPTLEARGSVSIINPANDTVTTLGFGAFDAAPPAGLRIVTPGGRPSLDWEPEYIAVSPDGSRAMVTLQEANGVAIIDLTSNGIAGVQSLGLKDHNLAVNRIDTSDRDGPGSTALAGNWKTVPVKGMYQPDAIAAYSAGGQTFYVIANEGDARNLADAVAGAFNEEIRVGSSSYVLDPTVFPNASVLKQNANLGRLTVTTSGGDLDGDGDYDEIHVFGGRSFSILDANGNMVFDSGNALEELLLARFPALVDDGRSDNKGVEPEGVTLLEVAGRTVAFVGLERGLKSVVAVYDVTDPTAPTFVDFITDAGSVSPEGLAAYAFGGDIFLAVANEVSGTTTVFSITPVPEPGTNAMMLAGVGILGALAARRRRR
jgi:DNA-binding beta-propeller fold protein YncE